MQLLIKGGEAAMKYVKTIVFALFLIVFTQLSGVKLSGIKGLSYTKAAHTSSITCTCTTRCDNYGNCFQDCMGSDCN